jgi:hypothetical protein
MEDARVKPFNMEKPIAVEEGSTAIQLNREL